MFTTKYILSGVYDDIRFYIKSRGLVQYIGDISARVKIKQN